MAVLQKIDNPYGMIQTVEHCESFSKKLEWGYEMGYNMTCDRIDDIKALFV